MMARTRMWRAVDLFCGGGGTTTGAEQSGRVSVVAAVNHWQTAIDTHSHNHPHVQHFCTPIDAIDPRHDRAVPNFDLLLASPECTHHSIARGGQPVEDQKRATPWHVLVWSEAKRPRAIAVENVREFRDWGPLRQKRDKATGKLLWRPDGRPWMEPDPKHKGETFRAWVRAIESLGYVVDHQLLNAADFGAATSRVRLFVTAIRSDLYRRRRLNWIPWPDPTHAGNHRAAYEIIDWSKPCPSIFGRKRPLAENTLRRIEIGLRKYVEPFIVRFRSSRGGIGKGGTVHGCDLPLGTITAGGTHHALCVPFQFKAIGNSPGLTHGIGEPVPTIVAVRENHAIVVPYISQYHNGPDGENRNYCVGLPIPTLDTQNRYAVVTPFLETLTHGGRENSILGPLSTITTAHRGEQALAIPFLTKYYGTGSVQSIADPLDTITTKDRFGLAMVSLVRTMRELGVADIGFRMLDVDELARATGFPEGYYFAGNKADRVKQVGNAVPPAFAKAICETLAEAA